MPNFRTPLLVEKEWDNYNSHTYLQMYRDLKSICGLDADAAMTDILIEDNLPISFLKKIKDLDKILPL